MSIQAGAAATVNNTYKMRIFPYTTRVPVTAIANDFRHICSDSMQGKMALRDAGTMGPSSEFWCRLPFRAAAMKSPNVRETGI